MYISQTTSPTICTVGEDNVLLFIDLGCTDETILSSLFILSSMVLLWSCAWSPVRKCQLAVVANRNSMPPSDMSCILTEQGQLVLEVCRYSQLPNCMCPSDCTKKSTVHVIGKLDLNDLAAAFKQTSTSVMLSFWCTLPLNSSPNNYNSSSGILMDESGFSRSSWIL